MLKIYNFLFTLIFFFFLYLFTFYNCIVPIGFLSCEIQVAFPGKSQLRQSRATQPKVHVGCFIVSIIHPTLTWTAGSYNVCTDVNACDCTQGCTDTVRESALKVDSGEGGGIFPSPHRGIEPASAACRSDALPTELHPHRYV